MTTDLGYDTVCENLGRIVACQFISVGLCLPIDKTYQVRKGVHNGQSTKNRKAEGRVGIRRYRRYVASIRNRVRGDQSGCDISRAPRLARELRRQSQSGDCPLHARRDRGRPGAWLRASEGETNGGGGAQCRRTAAREHGDLQRMGGPIACYRHGRHRPDGYGQSPAVDRLGSYGSGARESRARLCQMG